jgi:trehalose 6-phosphate phosphatase
MQARAGLSVESGHSLGMKTPARTVQIQKPKSSINNRSPHLFDRWPLVARRLRSAPHLALFLDFDGTLTPLQRRPGDVRLDAPTRTVLCWLARQPAVTLWVISGRRLADLRRRVKFSGIGCVGLHGWERRGTVANSRSAKLTAQARRLLADGVRNLPKVLVEEKGPVSVVHYRGARVGVVRRASAVVHQVVRRLEPALRVLPGKDVWEVLPREFKGKGATVKVLLAKLPPGTLPVYIGDDITDESAFAALPRGVTVRVGSPRLDEVPAVSADAARLHRPKARFTQAAFTLRNPREVRKFLERVAEEIRIRKAAERRGKK